MFRILVFILSLATSVCVASVPVKGVETTCLLPMPQQIEWKESVYTTTSTSFDCLWQGASKTLVSTISEAKVNENEAYRLLITPKGISVEATTQRGLLWAKQTLRQLFDEQLATMSRKRIRKISLRCCNIVDWPAFRVRGFLQDCGRSFMQFEELKREIDLASRFKINTFHWHLTENQGWRIESKRYPQLNEAHNMTRHEGQYYTQEQAKELVQYCKERGVTLIPEIDMPGHSAAFVRTFGCDMQSSEGMSILKELVVEACEVFKGVPYFHIGTDEVKFTNLNFVSEMVALVRSQGMKVISWNPGWTYQPGEIDMTHLWSYRGKAQKGIPAIDSKLHYLNHFDVFGDVVGLYLSKIYNEDVGSDDLAGSVIAIWNDRPLASDDAIIGENSFYPNLLALAERTWIGGGYQYFDKMGVILPPRNTDAFQAFQSFERRMLWHKDRAFQGEPFPYVQQTQAVWRVTDAFPNSGNLLKSFPPEEQLAAQYLFNDSVYHTQDVIGSGIYLRHVWGSTVSALYKKPQENSTAYAYTYVWSPKKQVVGLMFETQNLSRSERDSLPPQGKWDYRESKIWINNEAIQPPMWVEGKKTVHGERLLGNENAVSRKPIAVSLNKGWNKVLIKLPVGSFETPEVRLVKWMFTAAFVTLDGKHAVSNLVYSPDKKYNKKR